MSQAAPKQAHRARLQICSCDFIAALRVTMGSDRRRAWCTDHRLDLSANVTNTCVARTYACTSAGNLQCATQLSSVSAHARGSDQAPGEVTGAPGMGGVQQEATRRMHGTCAIPAQPGNSAP